jgi:hypothetical protein
MSFFRRCIMALLSIMATSAHGQLVINNAQYNNSRTGANLNETVLNTSTVNSDQFGKIFSHPVDDSVYALPLYIPNMEIPDKGIHNVVRSDDEQHRVRL